MLAGQTPFAGGSIASVLARRLVVDPPPVRDFNPAVPPEVEQIVLRALEREQDRRFQSAGELHDAIQATLQQLTTTRGAVPATMRTLPVARPADFGLPALTSRVPRDRAGVSFHRPAAAVLNRGSQASRRAGVLAATALLAALRSSRQ